MNRKKPNPVIRVQMNEYERQVIHDLCGRVIGWPDAMQSMGPFKSTRTPYPGT